MKILLLLTLLISSLLSDPKSFSQAKKLLKKQFPSGKTFYCGCDYKFKGKKSYIDFNTCGYTPRNLVTKKGKKNKRAYRIEWEHIVPAHNFGRQFKCWREGHQKCVKKNGKAYKGRKCCSKVNPTFKAMEADMKNLVPAIGEVNADRSNFRMGMIQGELRAYGKCDVEIDFKNRVVEPRPEIRSKVAKTYFYFEKRYGMKISPKDRRVLESWMK